MKKLFLLFVGILILFPIALADNTVEIRPNPATDSDTLSCDVIAHVDGVYAYTWFKDGIEQNINTKTVSADKTAVGDTWKCVVEVQIAGFGTVLLGDDSVTIQANANLNTPPVAAIDEPANNAVFYPGDKITLHGTGTDKEDGLLTGGMLKWYANNVYLDSSNTIYADASKLGIGSHEIKLVATDSRGATGTATITIQVKAKPVPTGSVKILPETVSDSDDLRCTVNGDISGIFYYTWLKNGVEQNIQSSTVTHDKTAVGDTWQCSVEVEVAGFGMVQLGDDSVTIPNRAPVASFDYSANYLTVSFTSTSSDPDESDSITSYSWNFGDSATSTEQNPTHTYSAAGTYPIILTVIDSHLGTGKYTKQITVSAMPPVVLQSIDVTPVDNTISYIDTLQYTATGHYSDGTTADITGDAAWSSSNAAIATVSNKLLTSSGGLASAVSLGQTAITAALGGISGTTNLYVINYAPTAVITLPANNAAFNSGSTITFEGSASDHEDGVLSGNSLVWTSSIDGNIGTGNTFSRTLSQGTHTITLTATDSKGDIDTAATTITVNAVAPPAGNHAPVLNAIGNKQVNVSQLLQFTISATDADNDALTYSASGLPSGASFNPATRTFAWTPIAGQVGNYQVTFTVTDAHGATDSETITITVNNMAPPANHPPVLNPIGNKQVNENQLLTFAISATDADNDPLTYSASGLPSGASFSGNTFSWTPTYEQSGSYSVTFSVSDGQLTASETITITIGNVPVAPLIRSVSANNTYVGKNLTISSEVISRDGGIGKVWAKIWQGQGLLKTINLTHNSGNSWSKTFKVTEDLVGATSFTVYAADSSGAEAQPVTDTLNVNEAELETYIGRISYEEYPKAGSELWFDISVENPGTVDWKNAKLAINIQDLGIRTTKTFNLDAGERVTKSIMVELPEDVNGQFDVRITLSNDDIYRVKYRLINLIS